MTLVTRNPTTGETLAEYAESTEADVQSALDQAAQAARQWGDVSPPERADGLRAVSAAIQRRREGLARLATLEMGKPLTQSYAEIDKCVRALDWFADQAPAWLADEQVPTEAFHSYVSYEPLGVLFAIMPWNFPHWQVIRALAPALAAGNAIVLKHAPNTTGCALALAEAVGGTDVPHGVLTVLTASTERTPQLCERVIGDGRVAAVTLTGSTSAGRAVASLAGHALKKSVLELGGSDAFIVLADADLDAAAYWATASRFQNNGQSCIATKRIVVEESVFELFTERLLQRVSSLRIGDPLDPATELGPLARADLLDALERQVNASVRAGARVRIGAQRIDGPGYFYAPTVLDQVTAEMPVLTEEVFGPAVPIIAAANAEEAIQLANASDYGLGSNLWTSNLARAKDLARQLQAGHTAINGMTASDPRLPFGGIKQSGYGRELSRHGLYEFVSTHTVVVDQQPRPTQ